MLYIAGKRQFSHLVQVLKLLIHFRTPLALTSLIKPHLPSMAETPVLLIWHPPVRLVFPSPTPKRHPG